MFKLRKNGKKNFKKLPFHTNQAKHLTLEGEVSRPLITAIITIAAIIALSLFLFYRAPLAGKAILFGTPGLNEAGIFLTENTVTEGNSIIIEVWANIPGQTVGLDFVLNHAGLILEGDCSVAVVSELWNSFKEIICEGDKIDFSDSTINYKDVKTGLFKIATINFAGALPGNYGLTFDSFNIYDLNPPHTDFISDGSPATILVRAGPAAPSDSDRDGVYDNDDNCPTQSNADQLDNDGNGIGDACDTSPTSLCTDSDGGLYYYTRGETVEIGIGGGAGGFDICLTDNSIEEKYCENEKLSLQEFNCEFGCVDGACLAAPEVCTPDTVINGVVSAYPDCQVTCKAGYNLIGTACISEPAALGDYNEDGNVCDTEIARAIDEFYQGILSDEAIATAIDNFYASEVC